MRLLVISASFLWLILAPYVATALGLGEIELDSALNEPFSAEIPLEVSDAAELDGLAVELASSSTFERYGLDRPAYLADFQFAVAANAAGDSVIELSSSGPVAEPFVTLLLDVKWSSGRLLREYTVLLDPPLFEPEAVQQTVVPAQSAPAAQPATTGEVDRSVAADSKVIEPTGLFQESAEEAGEQASSAAQPVANEPEPAPVISQAAAPAPQSAPVADTYVAQQGDTLWRIAERVRGDSGLSNNQMMLALYRANPDAFVGNINELKAGAILRVPQQADAVAVSPDQATAEVKQQHAAWTSGPADAGDSTLELVAPSEELGAGDNSEAQAGTSAGGDSAQAKQLQARLSDAEAELADSKRLLQLRDAELQALQARIADLEQAPETLPGATEEVAEEVVEDAVEGEAPTDPAEIFADEELLVDEEAVELAPEELPAEPLASESDLGVEPEAGADSLFSNIWVWVGAAVMLLLGLAVLRRRKTAAEDGAWDGQRADPEFDEAAGGAFEGLDNSTDDDTSHSDSILVEESSSDIFGDGADTDVHDIDTPESADAEPQAEPLEDISDDFNIAFDTIKSDTSSSSGLLDEPASTEAADSDIDSLDEDLELPLERTISTGAPLNLDQADPIAEAEFHMAYGLYDQAADLLTRALQDSPDNRAYRVKLIEVFFVWENKEGFLQQATLLREAVADDNDSDWSKVLILGKQLCPDEAIFAGESTAAPTADSMDLELTDAGETDIDFSLSGNEIEALDLDIGSEDDADIDLDLGVDFGDSLDDDLSLDLGSDDATMESPTVDVEGANAPTVEVNMDDLGASTMETPTIESPMFDPTVELPAADDDDSASTMETPTLEVEPHDAATTEMPALDDIEDVKDPTSLDVDLSGLADFDDFDEEDENPTTLEKIEDVLNLVDGNELAGDALFEDGDFTDVGTESADAEPDEPQFTDPNATLALDDLPVDDDSSSSAGSDAPFADAGELDLDLDGAADAEMDSDTDTAEQPQPPAHDAGDTAEQPALDTEAGLDLGASDGDSLVPDDATMTEVGTKLDLARAYIDMGDPEGARSILNEVLDEGGDTQQQEARQLLEELSD